MNAFDKAYYKHLRQYQREDEQDITASLSPQVKDFILSNNLKYNKKTQKWDTEGNVRVKNENLIDGHFPVPMGEVDGNFTCQSCDNLTSLKNAPSFVGKVFIVYACKNLTSLQFGPEQVGNLYDCSFTGVKNLIGAPKYVGYNFYCSFCDNLTTLNGLGQVESKVICQRCPKLRITDQERKTYTIVTNVK